MTLRVASGRQEGARGPTWKAREGRKDRWPPIPPSPASHQTKFDTTPTFIHSRLLPQGVTRHPCIPDAVPVRDVMALHRKHHPPSPTSFSIFRTAAEHVFPWLSRAERATADGAREELLWQHDVRRKSGPPSQVCLQPLCFHRYQDLATGRSDNHAVNVPLVWSRLGHGFL